MKHYLFFMLTLLSTCVNSYSQQKSQINELKNVIEDLKTNVAEAKDLAERNYQIANVEKERSDRLRYQLIANELAQKSIQMCNDELSDILAIHAYKFNSMGQGRNNDKDVYNALYQALSRHNKVPKKLVEQTFEFSFILNNEKNNSVITGDGEGQLISWNKNNGAWTKLDLFKYDNKGRSYSASLSEDGNQLVLLRPNEKGLKKNYVEFVNLGRGEKKLHKINGFESQVKKVVFAPNGLGFYALDNLGNIYFCDIENVTSTYNTTTVINEIVISKDGTKLAGISDNNELWIWNTIENKLLFNTNVGRGNNLTSLIFLPDSDHIAVCDKEGNLIFVSIQQKLNETFVLQTCSGIKQLQVNSSGTSMTTLSEDNSIKVWNLLDLAQPPIELSIPFSVSHVAFSPNEEEILYIQTFTNSNVEKDVKSSFIVNNLDLEVLAEELCGFINRNLTLDEWDIYVAQDLFYESICSDK